MVHNNIPHSSHLEQAHKAKLVDLGHVCLTRGEWGMVSAIACLIKWGGWRHA
jgi:hypothetical protein